jgi:hypothetical protein
VLAPFVDGDLLHFSPHSEENSPKVSGDCSEGVHDGDETLFHFWLG